MNINIKDELDLIGDIIEAMDDNYDISNKKERVDLTTGLERINGVLDNVWNKINMWYYSRKEIPRGKD